MSKKGKSTNLSLVARAVLLLTILSVAHLWTAPSENASSYLMVFAAVYFILVLLSIFLIISVQGKQKILPIISGLVALAMLCYDIFAATLIASVSF